MTKYIFFIFCSFNAIAQDNVQCWEYVGTNKQNDTVVFASSTLYVPFANINIETKLLDSICFAGKIADSISSSTNSERLTVGGKIPKHNVMLYLSNYNVNIRNGKYTIFRLGLAKGRFFEEDCAYTVYYAPNVGIFRVFDYCGSFLNDSFEGQDYFLTKYKTARGRKKVSNRVLKILKNSTYGINRGE